MYEYEKTLLYLLPVADKLTRVYRNRANGRIRASFYCHDKVEEQIMETISLVGVEWSIQIAKADVKSALCKLAPIDRAILEIQYIRRRDVIEALPFRSFPFSKRSFYRRTDRAIRRLSWLLRRNGNDEKWFKENFSSCPEIMRVYGKVLNRRDLYYRRKIGDFSFSRADKRRDVSR